MIGQGLLGRSRPAEPPPLEPTRALLAMLDELPVTEPLPAFVPPADPAAAGLEQPAIPQPPAMERVPDAADPWRTAGVAAEPRVESIEMIGRVLRASGDISFTRFERLSDFVNLSEGFITIRDATILKRNGEATRVTLPELWVSRDEITLVGQRDVEPTDRAGHLLWVRKTLHRLVFVTRGHLINAAIYLLPGASSAAFAEATDPHFVPLSDVNVRSLADRRVVHHYGFALLNRRQVVAIGESQAIGDAV